jgi:hypothetical protein
MLETLIITQPDMRKIAFAVGLDALLDEVIDGPARRP